MDKNVKEIKDLLHFRKGSWGVVDTYQWNFDCLIDDISRMKKMGFNPKTFEIPNGMFRNLCELGDKLNFIHDGVEYNAKIDLSAEYEHVYSFFE